MILLYLGQRSKAHTTGWLWHNVSSRVSSVFGTSALGLLAPDMLSLHQVFELQSQATQKAHVTPIAQLTRVPQAMQLT